MVFAKYLIFQILIAIVVKGINSLTTSHQLHKKYFCIKHGQFFFGDVCFGLMCARKKNGFF
jgi:hypothetical protein